MAAAARAVQVEWVIEQPQHAAGDPAARRGGSSQYRYQARSAPKRRGGEKDALGAAALGDAVEGRPLLRGAPAGTRLGEEDAVASRGCRAQPLAGLR